VHTHRQRDLDSETKSRDKEGAEAWGMPFPHGGSAHVSVSQDPVAVGPPIVVWCSRSPSVPCELKQQFHKAESDDKAKSHVDSHVGDTSRSAIQPR